MKSKYSQLYIYLDKPQLVDSNRLLLPATTKSLPIVLSLSCWAGGCPLYTHLSSTELSNSYIQDVNNKVLSTLQPLFRECQAQSLQPMTQRSKAPSLAWRFPGVYQALGEIDMCRRMLPDLRGKIYCQIQLRFDQIGALPLSMTSPQRQLIRLLEYTGIGAGIA